MNPRLKNTLNYALLFFMSAVTFTFDLISPIGIADGIGYIAVVLFTIWLENKTTTVACVITGIVLTILGYFLSPPGINDYIGLANRVLSICGMFIAGFIILKYKEAMFLVHNQKRDLEKLVHNRTAVLEKTLEDLRVAMERLEESNRLKSQFISTVSHEFRTPLATIRSSLFLVAKYGELGDKVKQRAHIAKIDRNIESLTDMLDDVLLVSRQGEKKVHARFEKLNISKFVSSIIDEMNTLVKEGQKIEYAHSGDDIFTFDDKILTHILQNLLSNAIKFSAAGQTISISTEITSRMFYLTVADNGMGISQEDQKHLYERFFRAHNATNIQGTGLGLHIVSNYTRMFNGNIECISTLGQGTKFVVRLGPVAAPVNT